MDPVETTFDATLKELIDVDTLGEVCRSYYKLFGVPVRIFDKDGTLLVDAAHVQEACKYLMRFEGCMVACTKHREMIKHNKSTSEDDEILDCFCGLQYLLAPIGFQKEILGKVVLGPYRPSDLSKIPADVFILEPTVSSEELTSLIGGMRVVSQSAIDKISKALMSVVDVILFSAHKAHVTSQMHIATVRESYRELTKKNRELAKMNESMKEFEQLKSNFLATVSHELRTPLTSIIGYSDMLVEGIAGDLGTEQKEFIKTIKSKGDELLGLISSILDFSQIETGYINLVCCDTNAASIVEAAVEKNQELADRRGTKLIISIDKGLPTVSIDPSKMRIAVEHLIDNALKFSQPGGTVRVSVSLFSSEDQEPDDDDGFGFALMVTPKMLDISVEDYGIGIATGDQHRIFTPFAQIDNSSTREHGGAGLGLAVVKSHVEAHGGSVLVTSHMDQGSKFTIRVPLIARS